MLKSLTLIAAESNVKLMKDNQFHFHNDTSSTNFCIFNRV